MNDPSESEQNELEETKPFWLSRNFAPTFQKRTKAQLEVTGIIPLRIERSLLAE